MAANIIIIKNPGATDLFLNDVKINLLAGDSYTIPYQSLGRLAYSADVYLLIASGQLVLNDGTQDLSFDEGAAALRSRGTSIQSTFQNHASRGNGFTSKTNQEAIEEARDSAPGLNSRYVLITGYDGNAGAGRWLELRHNNNLNNNPYIISELSEIKAQAASTRNNSTAVLSILVNGLQVLTMTFASQSTFNENGLSVILNPGDEVKLRVLSGSFDRLNHYMSIKVIG